eukprot:1363222-Amorphochlora_amoeboformis.AAC.2
MVMITVNDVVLWSIVFGIIVIDALSILVISQVTLDIEQRCVRNRAPVYIDAVLSVIVIGCVFIGMAEWRLYHSFREVTWRNSYWLSFACSLVLDVLSYSIGIVSPPVFVVYLAIFWIDSRAVNESSFRLSVLMLLSVSLVIGYCYSLVLVHHCHQPSLVRSIVTTMRDPFVLYVFLRLMEYVYIKYKYPRVGVVDELTTITRDALSKHNRQRTSGISSGPQLGHNGPKQSYQSRVNPQMTPPTTRTSEVRQGPHSNYDVTKGMGTNK